MRKQQEREAKAAAEVKKAGRARGRGGSTGLRKPVVGSRINTGLKSSASTATHTSGTTSTARGTGRGGGIARQSMIPVRGRGRGVR